MDMGEGEECGKGKRIGREDDGFGGGRVGDRWEGEIIARDEGEGEEGLGEECGAGWIGSEIDGDKEVGGGDGSWEGERLGRDEEEAGGDNEEMFREEKGRRKEVDLPETQEDEDELYVNGNFSLNVTWRLTNILLVKGFK